MIIAVGRLVALVISTVIVVAVSAIVWPLDSPLQKLASSGAKLCYAHDESLLVGAKLEGDEFGDEDVIAVSSVPSVQRLSLNGSKVTLHGLQSLQSLPKLVALSLNDTDLPDETFTVLCNLPALRELELDRCRWLTDERLGRLAGMRTLEFVSLAGNSVSVAGIDRLRQMPSLRFVRLDRCQQIDDSAIDAIVRLCEGTMINVGLSGTNVTQQGLLCLNARIPDGRIHLHPDTLPGLREISPRGHFSLGRRGEVTSFRRRGDLDGSVVPLLPGDLKVVGRNEEIREILLENSNVNDAMLQELPYLPNLQTLRLTGTPITDQGLEALSRFPNLKNLWLMETDIDGPGLSNLRELPLLTNLKIQTRRGDEILEHLESLDELQMLTIAAPLTDFDMERMAALPRLKFLALVGMGIRKSGIARLSKSSSLTELRFDGGVVDDSDVESIAGLSNVKWVMLSQTRVSQKGRDRLVALRPDMVVHWPSDIMSGHSSRGH